MSTSRGRVAVKATCDICGRERDAKPGVFRMVARRLTCSYHPFIPEERLDATPYMTFQARPIKDARPFDPRPTYQLAEEELFAVLKEHYQYGFIRLGSSSYSTAPPVTPFGAVAGDKTSAWSAAWCAIYFHALYAENKRPLAMVAAARAALKTIANWLVSTQEAGPGVVAGTGRLVGDTIPNVDSQPEWGGYNADASFVDQVARGDYQVLPSAAAGIALLRAYQVFGDAIYASAARACAWFVRNLQCGDLLPTKPASSDAAGLVAKHWGAWSGRMVFGTDNTYSHDNIYRVGSLLCLRFMALYLEVLGDETIGSPTINTTDPLAGVQTWRGSRAALVSTSIAEARAFWFTAQRDATLGQSLLGFSSETPTDGFNSYPAVKGGAVFGAGVGSWIWGTSTLDTSITGRDWALGISSMYAVDGASAFVTGVFDWLMTATSNAAFELPATYDDALVLRGTRGTYSPKTALASAITVRTSGLNFITPTNASSSYKLGATGLLAELYSARQQAAFKETKDALDQPRRLSTQSGRTLYLAPLGVCGLSFQPSGSVFATRDIGIADAAQTGLVYRQAPQAFLGRGRV